MKVNDLLQSTIQSTIPGAPKKIFCPNLTLLVTLSNDTLIKLEDAIDTVIPGAERERGEVAWFRRGQIY